MNRPGCAATCFYCDLILAKRHEHDHFPTPRRQGGQDVVCACINCHERKDRTPLDDWGPEAWCGLMALWPTMNVDQRILLAKMFSAVVDALYQLRATGLRPEPNATGQPTATTSE